MNKRERENLSGLMKMAWALHADAIEQGEDRSFGQSLKAAWSMNAGFDACAAKLKGVTYIQFSPSLFRSAMSRVWAGDPVNEQGAAYVSAMLGL